MAVDPRRPRSLGYSNSHLLALQFIKDFAETLNMPVVINVSQGMNAGAHDGTSNLEKGFDSITDNGRIPGIVIVKSAGNERDQKGHAKLLLASNSSEMLRWESKDIFRIKDVVELWFKASDRFKFRLINPIGDTTEWLDWSNLTLSGSFPSGNYYQITYTKYDSDNGDSRLLLTIMSGASATITRGEWSLEVESSTVRGSGEIHAWLERNSERPIVFSNHVSEEITLSIPGTAKYIVTVGSVTPSIPSRVARYSSYGPTRDGRFKPDIAAPGENITAAKSGSSNETIVMSGTSMAAPHVSGVIALLFSHWTKRQINDTDGQQLNAAQVQAMIIQTSQNYRNNWHPGMGFGIVDAKGLLQDS